MMSGMPLETCSAFNERWINTFYYKVASCWLFLLVRHDETNSRNSQFRERAQKSIHQKITENCKTSQHKTISRETSGQGRISPSPLLQNAAGIALSVVTRLQARQLEASLFNT
jgi:hypothetical protein